jgi:hypothetical protein
MRTGLRVRSRWAASRVGSIRDIACFEPCDGPAPAAQERDAHRQAPAAREPAAPHGASAARRPGHFAPTGEPDAPYETYARQL